MQRRMSDRLGRFLIACCCILFVVPGCQREGTTSVRKEARLSPSATTRVPPPSSLAKPLPSPPSVSRGPQEVPESRLRCWDAKLAALVGDTRPTRVFDGAAVDQEIERAQAGKPRRVTLEAHTGVTVNCECPFFALDADSVREGFLHPVYEGDVGRAVKWSVRGTYRLTGYYSGRRINHYQWHNENFLEPGEPPLEEGSGGDEERAYWPELHPEFCVESWCFIPSAQWKHDARTQDQPRQLAEMRQLGGRFCK